MTVHGEVSSGFEGVRDAFVANVSRRHELGGACCAHVHGEKVVDLWGGVRRKQTGEPWERDTMVIVYSATKGLAAMTLAVAHSRGWLDYDERVATYWPEFAQHANCCGASIRVIAPSGSSFRTKSRPHSDSTSPSGSLRRCPTRASRRSRVRHSSMCCSAFRCG
jgi:hypothetical protein